MRLNHRRQPAAPARAQQAHPFAGLIAAAPPQLKDIGAVPLANAKAPQGLHRGAPASNDDGEDLADDHLAEWVTQHAWLAMVPGRHDRQIRAVIGPRIVAARELNGIEQGKLATLLGYTTPTQVSLWETCVRTPPLHMLLNLCEVLGVSAGWLLGQVDEPEYDPRLARRAALSRSVRKQLDTVVDVLADVLYEHDMWTTPTDVAKLVVLGLKVEAAFDRFRAGNRAVFDDLAAGAPLVKAIAEMSSCSTKAKQALERHDSFEVRMQEALASARAVRPDPVDFEMSGTRRRCSQ